MAVGISVKKGDDNKSLRIEFADAVPSLSKIGAGESIPLEYAHAMIGYHIANQDEKGHVPDKKLDDIKAYW